MVVRDLKRLTYGDGKAHIVEDDRYVLCVGPLKDYQRGGWTPAPLSFPYCQGCRKAMLDAS